MCNELNERTDVDLINIKQLLCKDSILRPFIEQTSLKEREPQPSVYEALLRSINFQQLSGHSASAIHGRFLALFPNNYPSPEMILAFEDKKLKSVGLSKQKLSYIQNVARFFVENKLFEFIWNDHADEEIINLLTQIKGVGNWTVEMILMFTLRRNDVFTLNDLVVSNAMISLYGLGDLKGRVLKNKMLEIAENWRPYRTWACRYLWQWKDTVI